MRHLLILSIFFSYCAYAGTEFLKHQGWNTYLVAINFYHRTNPGSYRALELLPLDQIPTEDFAKEITDTVKEWSAFQNSRKGTLADRQTEIGISQRANGRLYDLLARAKSARNIVSIKAVVNSLPEGMRVALTPVDTLFLNGVMAQKIKEDLKTKNIEMNQIERVEVKSETGVLSYSFSSPNDIKYNIRLMDNATSTLTLKSSFKERRGLATPADKPDAILPVYSLKGSFYEKKESDLPFGKFPIKSEQYMGEDGSPHFFGDGHKH